MAVSQKALFAGQLRVVELQQALVLRLALQTARLFQRVCAGWFAGASSCGLHQPSLHLVAEQAQTARCPQAERPGKMQPGVEPGVCGQANLEVE
jgi:hypothetical protein